MTELCSVCGLDPTVHKTKRSARVVAQDPVMQRVLQRAARFVASDAPLMVLGETGTGKEALLRMLHANGPRAGKPFVAVNVAAVPAELLESELFGHSKGAFTGASSARRGLFHEADGGALFLDEIGEMPPVMQAKLLRVLQDGEVRALGQNRSLEVDVRILSATHNDLAEKVRRGEFREDLYFRLKVLTLVVPPLRERRGDILPLAMQFLSAEKTNAVRFTAAAEGLLLAARWPGNVRELQNAVRYGAALAGQAAEVDAADLPVDLGVAHTSQPGTLRSLAEIERQHIEAALAACGGSRTEAARMLGIARNTLWRKLRG